ncbi:unnamed protein product [Peronospora belbahrii]|uniref:Uncharacterized protein n=1 Tax=Peronospora belbahrii TaxID=622444 RepID=A0AAU9LJ95_9STRA|nr:unnamed protein product [Peronospora belbahrii]
MKIWGQHYSGVEKQHRLVVSHDRQLLGGSGAPSSMPHPEFRVVQEEAGVVKRQMIKLRNATDVSSLLSFYSSHDEEYKGSGNLCVVHCANVVSSRSWRRCTGYDCYERSATSRTACELRRKCRLQRNDDSDEIFLRDAINFLAEHSNEFDGTHPWYASFPRMTCYDGCVIITEAQKGGEGIDVGVFIEFTAMEKLKKMFSEVSNLYEKPMSGDDEVQD